MKAAYINKTGPPENILYGDLPAPKPGPTQCLVKVSAVALNPVDTYIRGGMIQMPLPSPFIVGCDLAGTVTEIGPGVTRFEPGDRVWGSNQGLLGRQGTFAEYCAVDECWLYPTPNGVTDEQAAASALVGITAHLGLVRDAKLEKGEMIFVNGGSGGVGSNVVQMSKALGARVVATAGSDKKVELCRKLGADFVINYKIQNVEVELKKIAPAGVNVWWETLREPNFDLAVGALSARGRMIVMAGREERPPLSVVALFVKSCSLRCFFFFVGWTEKKKRLRGRHN